MDVFQQGRTAPRVYQELWCDDCQKFIFICLNRSLEGYVIFRCPCSFETKRLIQGGVLSGVAQGAVPTTKEVIVPMLAAASQYPQLVPARTLHPLAAAGSMAAGRHGHLPVVVRSHTSFIEADKWKHLFGNPIYGDAG